MRASGKMGGRTPCPGCGTVLAADNTANVCGRCYREKQRDQLQKPPAVMDEQFFETDDFRAAFKSQHIGKVCKAYRNSPRHHRIIGKTLNQETLGRWLGLTQAQVSKLENGKPEYNLEVLRHYAQILRIPQRLLWFDLPGQSRFDQPQSTVVSEAEKVRERLAEMLSATLASEDSATDWEHTVYRLGRDTRWRPPELLTPELLANLDEVRNVYSRATSSHVQRRFARVAAQLSGLMSLTLLKTDDQAASLNWARTARLFSSQTNDPELRSWVQAQEAYYHFYADNVHAAVDAARYAQEITNSNPGVGSALAAALEARAHALQGNKPEALRAIGDAEEYTVNLNDESAIASAFGYNEAQLRFHQSSALAQLGEARAAFPIQDRALELCHPDDFMDRALVQFDRADCLIAVGDISAGMKSALDALIELDTPKAKGLIINRARKTLQLLPDKEGDHTEATALRDVVITIEREAAGEI